MIKSLDRFDHILTEDDHFKIHPEMLPFIGSLYDVNKILIISESHFVPENGVIPTEDEWYNLESSEEFIQKMDGNSHTRNVIEMPKHHRLFTNLNSALNQTNLKLNLEHVAWYNYFQRPAAFRNSIAPKPLDLEISKRIFEKILKTIKPNIVIFVSGKAFESLDKKDKFTFDESRQILLYQSFSPVIECVPHPNSQWWNRESSKYAERKTNQKRKGKQKFIDVVNQYCSI